jgi:endoglucanase
VAQPRRFVVLVGTALVALAGAIAVGASGSATTQAHPATTAPAAEVRVDSVGFLPRDVKRAYLMTDHAVSGVSYTVLDSHGATAWSGTVSGTSRGHWSAAYPDVYQLEFSGLHKAGSYQVTVSGPVTATSQPFSIESAKALYGRVLANGIKFFQVQRDGANQVAGPLHRKPSHLNDKHAAVYELPDFPHPNGSDTIRGKHLTRVPSHAVINAEGGWFDAGDFLKFTHTAAYADVLLYASERALGSAAPPALGREARHGETWLRRMWHEKSRTLYLQVGIGTGNRAGTFYGDHDLWRLPQSDDHNTSHRDRYATAHRPVFRAAPPGHLISPNLVGRVSAAFALAAQADAAKDPARARTELHAATSLYRMAATKHPPHPLVTSAPREYYPESTWHDDMALGASEIALADQDLGQPASFYLSAAAHWAKDYIANHSSDTFNLYDTSALAEADLITAMARAGSPAGLDVTRGALLANLRHQIRIGLTHSTSDPFRAGGDYDNFDVDSHTFGLISTVAMYDRATHSTAYQDFATAQRDWLFGANAWGASFMVGEGTNFPQCMQHQVANLSGSLDGKPPLVLGAVVNGPNSAGLFTGGLGGLQDGMRKCPVGGERYQAFNGRGSRYIDDVRSWQTDEPALDMTGAAVLAAALQEANPAAS